jgi:hypothetical protein
MFRDHSLRDAAIGRPHLVEPHINHAVKEILTAN